MKKAVFLDRDGVINKAIIKDGKPLSPNSLNELEILPGVRQSITKLKKLNFVCLVVTNQPNVARKKIDKNSVIQMNNYLKNEIPLDDIFVCYHDDKDNCDCRKPKPGLIMRAAKDMNIDLNLSWMVGDMTSDIEAANRAGIRSILLSKQDCGFGNKCSVTPDAKCLDLKDAVKLITQKD